MRRFQNKERQTVMRDCYSSVICAQELGSKYHSS